MKKLSIVILLVISLALGGCAGMSDTEQRTLSGAAIGTAAGGVVGAIAGHTGIGLAGRGRRRSRWLSVRSSRESSAKGPRSSLRARLRGRQEESIE